MQAVFVSVVYAAAFACAPAGPAPAPAEAGGAATPEPATTAAGSGVSHQAHVDLASAEATTASDSGPAADPIAYERPSHWPAALPVPAAIPLANSMATVGDSGDVWLRHWLPPAQGDAAIAAWIAALRSQGATLAAACEAASPRDCAFSLDGRRGRLSVDLRLPGSEHALVLVQLGPRGLVPIRALPGPCVSPGGLEREVTVHSGGIDHQGEYRSSSTRWRIAAFDGPDLDGDGIPERLVPVKSKENCPWSIPHDVYVMRGTCGHKVGTIVGFVDEPTYVAPMVKGLRELHTSAEWADYGRDRPEPIHHTVLRVYRFDGRSLVLRKTDKHAGVCHHCGVASCQ